MKQTGLRGADENQIKCLHCSVSSKQGEGVVVIFLDWEVDQVHFVITV